MLLLPVPAFAVYLVAKGAIGSPTNSDSVKIRPDFVLTFCPTLLWLVIISFIECKDLMFTRLAKHGGMSFLSSMMPSVLGNAAVLDVTITTSTTNQIDDVQHDITKEPAQSKAECVLSQQPVSAEDLGDTSIPLGFGIYISGQPSRSVSKHVPPVPELPCIMQVAEDLGPEDELISFSITESSGPTQAASVDPCGLAAIRRLETDVVRYVGLVVNTALANLAEHHVRELHNEAELSLRQQRKSYAVKLAVCKQMMSGRVTRHGMARPPIDFSGHSLGHNSSRMSSNTPSGQEHLVGLDGKWKISRLTKNTPRWLHQLVINGHEVTLADGTLSQLKCIDGRIFLEGGSLRIEGDCLHRQGKSQQSHQMYAHLHVEHTDDSNNDNFTRTPGALTARSMAWEDDSDRGTIVSEASSSDGPEQAARVRTIHSLDVTALSLAQDEEDEEDEVDLEDQQFLPSIAAALYGKRH